MSATASVHAGGLACAFGVNVTITVLSPLAIAVATGLAPPPALLVTPGVAVAGGNLPCADPSLNVRSQQYCVPATRCVTTAPPAPPAPILNTVAEPAASRTGKSYTVLPTTAYVKAFLVLAIVATKFLAPAVVWLAIVNSPAPLPVKLFRPLRSDPPSYCNDNAFETVEPFQNGVPALPVAPVSVAFSVPVTLVAT